MIDDRMAKRAKLAIREGIAEDAESERQHAEGIKAKRASTASLVVQELVVRDFANLSSLQEQDINLFHWAFLATMLMLVSIGISLAFPALGIVICVLSVWLITFGPIELATAFKTHLRILHQLPWAFFVMLWQLPWAFCGALTIFICLKFKSTMPLFEDILLALAVGALARMFIAGRRQYTLSPAYPRLNLLLRFLSALGVIGVVGAASFAVFFGTFYCALLISGVELWTPNDWIWIRSVVIGLVPSLVAALLLFRLLSSR
jgi:hypothetical protein